MQIAQELDAQEQTLMAEFGTDTSDFKSFMKVLWLILSLISH